MYEYVKYDILSDMFTMAKMGKTKTDIRNYVFEIALHSYLNDCITFDEYGDILNDIKTALKLI